MKLTALFLLLSISSLAQSVHNRTSGVNYFNMVDCFAALTDGGSNALIEIDGPLTVTATATLSKNFSSLTIVGVGQPTIDCNQLDSWISLNGTGKTLQNITVENFRIINNNTVTTSAAAIRFTTVKGKNYLKRITFNSCSIPVRATTAMGSLINEDIVALNYTMGCLRYGQGSQTGVNPGVADMDTLIFRRCKFDATQNSNTEADLVIKRMTYTLVEDCQFTNPSKYAISIYDPVLNSNIVIRRNTFVNGHAKATSGGTVDVAPNVTTGTGSTANVTLESNIFSGEKGPAFFHTNGLSTSILNNLFIEGTGNAGNMISFVTSKNFLNHYNNIYVCNTTNNNALISAGTMTYDSDQLRSDYNIYYKTTARGIFGGTTVGGTQAQALSASTLAAVQAKGYDSHGISTQPVFNTTQKKFSSYRLATTSAGVATGNTSFPPSIAPNGRGLLAAPYGLGPFPLRSQAYRTGRYRIVKQS